MVRPGAGAGGGIEPAAGFVGSAGAGISPAEAADFALLGPPTPAELEASTSG